MVVFHIIAVKFLAPLVFFNHEQAGGLRLLIGSEAGATVQALAPTAYAVIYTTGVCNLGIVIATIGTIHNALHHIAIYDNITTIYSVCQALIVRG